MFVYVINTLLTHTGRSREREAGDKELWLPTTSAACLVLSCGQLQAFSQAPGNYYLKGGHAVPPESLVLKIWPWVDEALAMYERGDIEKVDLCGIEFLRLLKKLRVVFLQNAAILMKDYPDVEIWSLQVFKEPDWPAFS